MSSSREQNTTLQVWFLCAICTNDGRYLFDTRKEVGDVDHLKVLANDGAGILRNAAEGGIANRYERAVGCDGRDSVGRPQRVTLPLIADILIADIKRQERSGREVPTLDSRHESTEART